MLDLELVLTGTVMGEFWRFLDRPKYNIFFSCSIIYIFHFGKNSATDSVTLRIKLVWPKEKKITFFKNNSEVYHFDAVIVTVPDNELHGSIVKIQQPPNH